jgi:large subunit ribosomal protein L3
MGAERVTVQNLTVVGTDTEEGLVLVQGAVPGSRGGYVLICDAVKRARPDEAPYPAGLVGGGEATTEVSEDTAVEQSDAAGEEEAKD